MIKTSRNPHKQRDSSAHARAQWARTRERRSARFARGSRSLRSRSSRSSCSRRGRQWVAVVAICIPIPSFPAAPSPRVVPAHSPPLRAAGVLGLWPVGLCRTRAGARSRVRGVAPSGGCSPPSPRPPARLPLCGSAPLAPLGPPCPPSAGPLAAFAARPLAFSPLPFGSVRASCPPFAGPLSPLAAPPRPFLAFGSDRPAVRRCSALVPRAVGAAAPTPLLLPLGQSFSVPV